MPDPDIMQAIHDQSERHHKGMHDIGIVLAKQQEKLDQIFTLIAGDPIKDVAGYSNRLRAVEKWIENAVGWSLRKWGGERITKLIDHGAAALMIWFVIMAAKGAMIDLMDQTMQVNYQRDRVALNQEK